MRVLVLDQAKTTGYAIYDNDKLMEYGVIEIGKKNMVYEEMLPVAKVEFANLIGKVRPDKIVLEDIQLQNGNVSTYKKLAMLMGVLICLLHEMSLPHEMVSPTRWQCGLGIKGKKRAEKKANTVLFVKETFSIDDISEDEADAIAMGLYVLQKGSENNDYN